MLFAVVVWMYLLSCGQIYSFSEWVFATVFIFTVDFRERNSCISFSEKAKKTGRFICRERLLG